LSLSSKVGLFGGTFNPVHNAHLKVAQKSIEQIGLDRVIMVPSKNPPHKTTRGIPDADTRYKMVELAIQGEENLEVSRVEIERDGPSYTIDTIIEMKKVYDDLVFIVGADNLVKIETWKEPEKLLKSCPFVIAPRGGYKKADFDDKIFDGKDLRFLDMDEISISSTKIRERIMDGESINSMVPSAVVDYILSKGLYQAVPGGV